MQLWYRKHVSRAITGKRIYFPDWMTLTSNSVICHPCRLYGWLMDWEGMRDRSSGNPSVVICGRHYQTYLLWAGWHRQWTCRQRRGGYRASQLWGNKRLMEFHNCACDQMKSVLECVSTTIQVSNNIWPHQALKWWDFGILFHWLEYTVLKWLSITLI